MLNRLVSLIAALFTLVSVVHASATLDIYIDPTTKAFVGTDLSDIGGAIDVQNYVVTATIYGGSQTRHYFGGLFDAVALRYWNANKDLVSGPIAANNMCYYVGTSLYACSTGFNGSGNGVNNEVKTFCALSNGDLMVGGKFTVAGGYSNTTYLSCYQFVNGWSGVNNTYVTLSGGGGYVDSMWVDSNYKLHISGNFNVAYGKINSSGTYGYINGLSSVVLWNGYYSSFSSGYFQSP